MPITRKSVLKAVAAGLCVIALAWAFASIALYRVMRRPPEQFARVMTRVPEPYAFLVLPFSMLWRHARAGALEIGDPVPDFTLAKLDKTGRIQLASFAQQARPVVLVFGSYT